MRKTTFLVTLAAFLALIWSLATQAGDYQDGWYAGWKRGYCSTTAYPSDCLAPPPPPAPPAPAQSATWKDGYDEGFRAGRREGRQHGAGLANS